MGPATPLVPTFVGRPDESSLQFDLSQIMLTNYSNGAALTKYIFMRDAGNRTGRNWVDIAEYPIGSSVGVVTVPNLFPASIYYFRGVYENEFNFRGNISDIAIAMTGLLPTAPSGLHRRNVEPSNSSVPLGWTKSGQSQHLSIIRYEIDARVGNDPFALVRTIGGYSSMAEVGGLVAGTTYDFRIRAQYF